MGNVDDLCTSMHHWCEDMDMHYGQGNSEFPLPRYDFSYGGSTDCTAMLAHCLDEGGYDVPYSVYSGNIADALENIGWTREYADGYQPHGVAVVVNYANHGALWDGSQIVEFGGDPHNGYCTTHGWYSYPWNVYMYPPEGGSYSGGSSESYEPRESPVTDVSREDGQTGGGIVYEVHCPGLGWLGAVNLVDDSDDGYAGWQERAIDGIRAYREDGQPLRIQTIMSDGSEPSWTTFAGSMFGENSDGDGYAGDIDSGNSIIGLRVEGAEVRVACSNEPWLGWSTYGSMTVEGDDFAGEDLEKRMPIVAVQMRC